ncbi:hypothetical protein NE237_021318 [Protea cynaroides]|uniref:Uncharacterized protein n=1 Tax=Protea cynaroides TaxID=273540 RepID=A0A9Q0H8A6_9MAGN|nr:hypothetical protein NE237_021318 [Protea cynaroides]
MVEREMISYGLSWMCYHVEALEILLLGLCGVPKESLRIHELCLKSAPGFAMRCAGADQISVLITVIVTSVNKMPKLYAINDAVPMTPGIQLKVGWTWTVVRWMSSI